MYASLRMIREFDRLGLPWIVENPQTSRLWLCPGFVALMKQSNVQFVVFHMCQFGSKWKQTTSIMTGNIPEHMRQPLRRTCSGRRGFCSRTGKRHLVLSGSSPSGVPWTRIAQVYPRNLCVALAKLLCYQVVPCLWHFLVFFSVSCLKEALRPHCIPQTPRAVHILDTGTILVRHACFFCRVMPNATSGDSAESIAGFFSCRGEVTLDKGASERHESESKFAFSTYVWRTTHLSLSLSLSRHSFVVHSLSFV